MVLAATDPSDASCPPCLTSSPALTPPWKAAMPSSGRPTKRGGRAGKVLRVASTRCGIAVPLHDSPPARPPGILSYVPRSGPDSPAIRGNFSTASSSTLTGRGRFSSATIPLSHAPLRSATLRVSVLGLFARHSFQAPTPDSTSSARCSASAIKRGLTALRGGVRAIDGIRVVHGSKMPGDRKDKRPWRVGIT